MKIYISSSWKNRDTVRHVATVLRSKGHEVYDFTDPICRRTPEIPPEKYPEQFDPSRHIYKAYIDKPEWRAAVEGNREAILWADLIVLILPCGIDSHADWAFGVGAGKRSVIIGHPKAGERSPVHLWAEAMFNCNVEFYEWLQSKA
jgi:hypothetical protein